MADDPPNTKSNPTAQAFRPRDWISLTPTLLRIMTFVGADLALARIEQDLREGRLRAALVAPDGTLKMLDAADWQQRTVCAPLIPAEGVRVEPYEEGRWFVWRADLDEHYPTATATPLSTTPQDRQPSTSAAEADAPPPAPPAEPAPKGT
jgi:hypothetical protein